ncbi:hypothetical protein H920_06623 [Fukomys damarensis]|uniref:Uncharacterized protein n=1 Tax=Fukomys damarensis TaxID=885580 RepID=A0A091DIU3_FUKDA|nr:hypothetical protein H920_06623 [Fukomys damarensis]
MTAPDLCIVASSPLLSTEVSTATLPAALRAPLTLCAERPRRTRVLCCGAQPQPFPWAFAVPSRVTAGSHLRVFLSGGAPWPLLPVRGEAPVKVLTRGSTGRRAGAGKREGGKRWRRSPQRGEVSGLGREEELTFGKRPSRSGSEQPLTPVNSDLPRILRSSPNSAKTVGHL